MTNKQKVVIEELVKNIDLIIENKYKEVGRVPTMEDKIKVLKESELKLRPEALTYAISLLKPQEALLFKDKRITLERN